MIGLMKKGGWGEVFSLGKECSRAQRKPLAILPSGAWSKAPQLACKGGNYFIAIVALTAFCQPSYNFAASVASILGLN